MQLNRFKTSTQNTFLLVEGISFLAKSVKIIRPVAKRIRSPDFTLFSSGNRYISSFYQATDAIDELYIGGLRDSTLIWFWRGDFGFDVFKKNLSLEETREMLLSGELNKEFEFSRNTNKYE